MRAGELEELSGAVEGRGFAGEIVVGLRLLLLRGHDLKTRYDNAAVPQPNRDVNRPICHDSEPDS